MPQDAPVPSFRIDEKKIGRLNMVTLKQGTHRRARRVFGNDPVGEIINLSGIASQNLAIERRQLVHP